MNILGVTEKKGELRNYENDTKRMGGETAVLVVLTDERIVAELCVHHKFTEAVDGTWPSEAPTTLRASLSWIMLNRPCSIST